MIDVSKLSDFQRGLRANIRNFLMTATLAQLSTEVAISIERGDHFRAQCVRELMEEV